MFSRHFDFNPHSLVNFVGGGGKTVLIEKLMEEFITQDSVLYTTTTRIHPPAPCRDRIIISCDNLKLLETLVVQAACSRPHRHYKIVATRHFMEPDLLKGVPVDFLDATDRSLFAMLLNEADGSARFSIKLPREGEPVLMRQADYLVPVIGIDCLHKPAGDDTLFRFQTQSGRFSIRKGEPITPELAARILMHPQGVCRDRTEGTAIIPFINKADSPAMDSDARILASHILHNDNFPVNRVVFGSVLEERSDSISDA